MKLAQCLPLSTAALVLLFTCVLPAPARTTPPPAPPVTQPAVTPPSAPPAVPPPVSPLTSALPGYSAAPLLSPGLESLDILGPGLLATCPQQGHNFLARCQAAPEASLLDLAGRPLPPKLKIRLGDRTEQVILFSTPKDPVNPNLPVKWGLATPDGKFVQKPVWERVHLLNARAVAYGLATPCLPMPSSSKQPGTSPNAICIRYGLFSVDLRRTFPADFDSLVYDNAAPYAVKKAGGKWGYIDDQNRTVVPFLYDSAARCSDGLCRATLGRDTVYFDKAGKKVLTVAMNADDFFEGLAAVANPEHKFGFIDHAGGLAIKHLYQAAESFHEGFAAVQLAGKWGYVDRTGKTVVPFKWTEAGDFSDGFARVVLETVGRDGKTVSVVTAVLNARGKTIWRGAGRYNFYISKGFPQISDQDQGKYGVLDPVSGHLVVPMKYEQTTTSENGLTIAGDGSRLEGLLDRTGTVLLPLAEQEIHFNTVGVLVRTAGPRPTARLLDPTGRKTLTLANYEELDGWWTSLPHLGTFRRGATGGLMDARGRELCTVHGASDGRFVTNATPVLEQRYYKRFSTGAFRHLFASEGLVKFKVNGRWGLYDLQCREVSAPSWEDVGLMRFWMVPVKTGGKWGLLKITARTPAL